MGELIKQVAPNISIHSLRMEGDLSSRVSIDRTQNFNPLPPYGGRHKVRGFVHKHKAFQSTPSVWRETVVAAAHLVRDMYFNPLPPYGGRLASDRNDVRSRHFNPLPPYGGRPWIEMPTCTHLSKFQSTPSVWRETVGNGRALRTLDISIHSLRMEGDQYPQLIFPVRAYFNPLPPYGGRLHGSFHNFRFRHISIHSLRMEGDCF